MSDKKVEELLPRVAKKIERYTTVILVPGTVVYFPDWYASELIHPVEVDVPTDRLKSIDEE